MNSNEKLIDMAYDSMLKSYSPYSNFRVGAAIIDECDNVYTGTNIENKSYGATICAERVAIFKSISSGARIIKLVAIISDLEDYIFPCGICRQVLSEFSKKSTQVICSKNNKEFKIYSMKDLLPMEFGF